MRLLIASSVAASLVLSVTCQAASLVISCDPMEGDSFTSRGSLQKIERAKDCMTGIRPNFVMENKKDDTLRVLFVPSDSADKLTQLRGTNSTTAVILLADEATGNFTAAANWDNAESWLFSFYPKFGMGNFTQHRYTARGEMFTRNCYSVCKFKES